jgi:pimeloyl-ACP methyl ester carboxylesterase
MNTPPAATTPNVGKTARYFDGEVPGGETPDGHSLPVEAHWPLDELTLAGLSWVASDVRKDDVPTIALHGWLDNAASFSRLAPRLSAQGPFHAIDLAGHGHSGHRSPGHDYTLVDYVADVAELIERHFEGPVNLIGHSLGGIIAAFYGAAFPEKLRRLILIDSLGPLTAEPEQAPGQLRKAILKKIKGSGASPVYATVQEAATARAGGLSPLTPEAAEALVPRNLQQMESGFQWRTDPRLRYPSMMRFDEAQASGFLQAIATPTLFICAESGLLGGRSDWQHRAALIDSLKQVSLAGSHHLHLDGDVAPVIEVVEEFLNS